MTLLTLLSIVILIELTYLVVRDTDTSKFSSRTRKVYVDTSALMDARIVTAAQTGFIPDHLLIPKSVIGELQLLADQADNEKRLRARRGLDAIAELQSIDGLKVTVVNDGPLKQGGVDARLIELARKKRGAICTIDFNLNKAASVQGVQILNINELAGNIRMAFLPGESISLALSQKGQNSTQAVGYLSDGTMVVVDKAAAFIGKTVEIEFIRSLQTSAGRMMFAKLAKSVTLPHADTATDAKRQTSGRKPLAKNNATNPTRSRNSRKQSKEDSLINLVNEQDTL